MVMLWQIIDLQKVWTVILFVGQFLEFVFLVVESLLILLQKIILHILKVTDFGGVLI